MDNKRQRLMEKIRALLEMAQRGTEHEAAIAAEKIQRLTMQYGIDLSELEAQGQDIGEETTATPIAHESLRHTWKGVLALGIAEANLCKTFWRKDVYQGGYNLFCIGSPTNIEVCKALYGYLTVTVDRLTGEAASTERKRYQAYLSQWHPGLGAKQPEPEWKTWRNNFRQGCCDRIYRRLKDRLRQMEQEGFSTDTEDTSVGRPAEPGVSALVVRTAIERAQKGIAKWERDNGLKLKKRSASKQRYNPGGYSSGYKAGATVGLNAQIRGGNSSRSLPS